MKTAESQTGEEGGACSAASQAEHYYRNKMEATLQILRNREETLRVQAETLRATELRLAEAARRDHVLRDQLAALHQELNKLRRQTAAVAEAATLAQAADDAASREGRPPPPVPQDDFEVVCDLYRDCFYEVAKQQDRIEILRKSYMDARATDRHKSRTIGDLQKQLSSQRWSLDKCQDIAMEVEHLKSEITDYLNSSTNDSGVWERCEDPLAAELAEDLQDILRQLLTLRDVLRSDCTCGLREENERLSNQKHDLDVQVSEWREKALALEEALAERSCYAERVDQQLALKDEQVCRLQSQLDAAEAALRDAPAQDAIDALRARLQGLQECLDVKTDELERSRADCASRGITIEHLKEQLQEAERALRENGEVRGEVSQLSCQVRAWRAQLADSAERVRALEDELEVARRRCHQLERSYREKAECSARLQAELNEATERGAELCEESRRVVSALRGWARRVRDAHARQQRRLHDQDAELHDLRRRLLLEPDRRRHHSCCRAGDASPISTSSRSSQKTIKINPNHMRGGVRAADASSGCSSPDTPLTSASTSPLFCRKPAQHLRASRGESSAEALMSRVEQLQAALASGRQRWARPPPPRPHTSRT